jgi:tetratricopeptide (TPR) repeat protein
LPKEAILEYSKAFTITKEVLKKNPVLGSGPGTYAQDFSLYRPVELNGSAYWQIRFDKSASHFLEILATSGLPAWLSYFLVISLIIYLNVVLIIKYLKRGQPSLTDGDYNLIITIFTVFILLFFSQLAWLTNTVLNFTFWFFSGLIIAFWQLNNHSLFKERIINLNKSLIFFRLFLLILFLLSAGWIMLAAFEIKFFAAELIAAQGASREKSLMTAVKLNPYRYNYDISLAKFYLSRARVEALQPAPKRDNGYIQLNITQAVATAKQAAAQAPNSVLAQETLGMIYRDIRPLTIGSEPWAVRSFTRAFELEPTNPVLATELAKAYLNNNDTANAEKYFIKAAELKPDYYEAKFGLAKVYLKNKKDSLAFNLLNELAVQVYDPEIFYELGRFYYNHGEVDKALDRFKLVLSISPKHSNSLYSLGIAYEAKGDIKEALKYYEKVLELNPGNEEVSKKIKELSK